MQVADDEIYLVVNAGCREKDLNHIGKYLEKFQVSLPSSNRKFALKCLKHERLPIWSLCSSQACSGLRACMLHC